MERILLERYKSNLPEQLRQRTLVFLIRNGQVLLGKKKRGFGEGRWLGIGGKVGPGETVEEAMIRETIEEVGMEPVNATRVGTLDFYFPHVEEPKRWNQRVCVFLTQEWKGEPVESEEIFPQWFNVSDVPLDLMWSDAPHWLPKILDGVCLDAEFVYDPDLGIEDMKITEEG